MTSIYIYGCGGFGREVLQIILDLRGAGESIDCAGFLVDEGISAPATVQGVPVLPFDAGFKPVNNAEFVVALGAPQVRRRIVGELRSRLSARFAVLVHPRAWIGRNVRLGEGCVVCAGAAITTDIVLNEHVHVNILATIGHDTVIGSFVTLSPGANVSGNVNLGEGCDIGTGVSIIPGVSVGAWSTIGAGASVIRSIPENTIAVGVPAKVVKQKEPGWKG
jgi:sugar O-acyltransferase (sialic acid O-acetyltransferase NeuD family)